MASKVPTDVVVSGHIDTHNQATIQSTCDVI